ncbi:MAG TPA: hypothetical protein VFJ25_04625 [Casimicrobiaceae bacterium]|nr:hypothetical protein [Casimicrobiaceae bacterium]
MTRTAVQSYPPPVSVRSGGFPIKPAGGGSTPPPAISGGPQNIREANMPVPQDELADEATFQRLFQSLTLRVDGLEAAIGELRASIGRFDRYSRRHHFRQSVEVERTIVELAAAAVSVIELEQRLRMLERAIGADVDTGEPS